MATPEQKAASGKVMEAVTALNRALGEAGSQNLFVELQHSNEVGSRNGQYSVSVIETREIVLP